MADAKKTGIMSQSITDYVNAHNRAEVLIESGDVRAAISELVPYRGAWRAAKLCYKYAQIHHIEDRRKHYRIGRSRAGWWYWHYRQRSPRLIAFLAHNR